MSVTEYHPEPPQLSAHERWREGVSCRIDQSSHTEVDVSEANEIPPISEKMTVNEIIRAAPATAEVFSRFGIDMCCGGTVPVRSVAERDGLDAGEIWGALRELLGRPE